MFTIPDLNLAMIEFTYDLALRIQRGVLTTVSLSASNDIGRSDFSNEISFTIPTESNISLCHCSEIYLY